MAFYKRQQDVEKKHSRLVQFILKDLTHGMFAVLSVYKISRAFMTRDLANGGVSSA